MSRDNRTLAISIASIVISVASIVISVTR